MKPRASFVLAAFLLLAQAAAHGEVLEQTLQVPVRIRDAYGKEIAQDIVVTVFEPQGRPAHTMMLIHHGRPPDNAARGRMGRQRFSQAATQFASAGYSVWVPTRIGYGASGTAEDPEDTGTCSDKRYGPGFAAGADQALQVVDYARRNGRTEAAHFVSVGQSFGGGISVALAARNPAGLVAAVNFAGGSGGDPVSRPGEPCSSYKLEELFAGYGRTARVPMLWIYTENDRFFGPRRSRAWFNAFRDQGGTGQLVLLAPFGEDGHQLFTRGIDIWKPIVDRFLGEHVRAEAR